MPAGDAGSLDVHVTASHRPSALHVQRRTENCAVEARNVAADVLAKPAGLVRRQIRVDFGRGGGRRRGRRHRLSALLSSASRLPRAALGVVDEHGDAFQIHQCITIAKCCNRSLPVF